MAQKFAYNSGTYQETNSETIHLEFGLFFDGTLNNKNNTELRLKVLNQNDLRILPSDSEKEVKRKEEELKYRRNKISESLFEFMIPYNDKKNVEKQTDITDYRQADSRNWFDKQGVDNSLMNDYTNVARMWNCCNENYAIYIEGIGTLDGQKDVNDGFRFGAGETGIRGKVRKGCKMLAEKIKGKLLFKEKVNIGLTLDVFGFSRGAAAARNFLYEVNVSDKRKEDINLNSKKIKIPINVSGYGFEGTSYIEETTFYDKDNILVHSEFLIGDKMPKYGYLGYYLLQEGIDPDMLKLHIRFLGIYDTVSSYEESGNLIKGMWQSAGLTDYFDDDIEQLQLNNLGSFEKAVHFTAMDEHRENFALTHFSEEMLLKPKYNCIEKAFPGVHCDIGGAYETGTEYVDEIENSNYNPELDTLHEDLISKYWYKREQLNLSFFKLSGTRFLRKEYSYIPLHFMQDFFKSLLGNNHQNIITKNVVIDYPISDPQDKILIKVKERLRKYVFRDENKKEEERSEEEKEWRFIPDCEIENKYNQIRDEVLMEITQRALKEMQERDREENRRLIKESLKIRDSSNKNVYFPPKKQTRDGEINAEIYSRNSVFEEQKILRILRNKYLHWSANRDWFGMQPTSDRKRKEY